MPMTIDELVQKVSARLDKVIEAHSSDPAYGNLRRGWIFGQELVPGKTEWMLAYEDAGRSSHVVGLEYIASNALFRVTGEPDTRTTNKPKTETTSEDEALRLVEVRVKAVPTWLATIYAIK